MCFAVIERIPLETVLARQVSGVPVVSESCQSGILQSRDADCKKAAVLLNGLFVEERNNGGNGIFAPDTCCFLLCWCRVNMLEFRKHLCCKAEEALLSRDFWLKQK